MLASSTCEVQILEFAFSRRICCSRVCIAAIRYCPQHLLRRADNTARHGRLNSSLAAKRPHAGLYPHPRYAEALRRKPKNNVTRLFTRRGKPSSAIKSAATLTSLYNFEFANQRAVVNFARGPTCCCNSTPNTSGESVLSPRHHNDVKAKRFRRSTHDVRFARMDIRATRTGWHFQFADALCPSPAASAAAVASSSSRRKHVQSVRSSVTCWGEQRQTP